jgi:outer membrane protein assembly factor BamB
MIKTPRWPDREVGDPVASGIALANGVAYFTTMMGGKLVALNSATGEMLNEISLPPVWSGPSVSRGRVYVGSGSIFMDAAQQGAVFCFGLPDPD